MRGAQQERTVFTGFGPAVSKTAMKRMSEQMRSWRLHRRTTASERDLARWINPIVSGWMNYYAGSTGRSFIRCCGPHQRLPGALDEEEIQAAEDLQEGPRGLGPGHPPIPALLRAQAVGFPSSDGEVEKSPVTGDRR
ncbi:group II intron maturase-specific domain-containing protein [Nonomuraea fuscirosea]|uniref:group II intron maturase-specific domain-containing protein n=1 Tax=Nonomuraea fuscirosea TaxID=1291556 RepID=UPI001C6378C1